MKNFARVAVAVAAFGFSGAASAQGLLNPEAGPRPEIRQDQRRPEPQRQEPQRQEPQRQEPQRQQQERGRPDNRGQEYRGAENRGGQQHDWKRGERMDRDEWQRGGRIDYRERHLRAPPRGYEWREVNGSLILGAIATGVIADIILNSQR